MKLSLISIVWLLSSSCSEDKETPEQIERNKILAVEDHLRNNTWGLNDLTVSVRVESRAVPLLANVADENGMVQPGIYDSYAIFGDNNRQLNYSYSFTRDDILVDTAQGADFNRVAGYYVLSTSQIRVNPDASNKIVFEYINDLERNQFVMKTGSNYSEEFVSAINTRLVNSMLSGKPTKLASAVVKMLQENENVSEAIQRFFFVFLHSKIEEITQSPEEISEKLARFVIDKLKEIDWETLLYDKILEFLESIKTDNPEERASELAKRVADKIEASLSQSNLYDTLLPVVQEIENETLPVLASRIAIAVYSKIATELSEENIYNRVYPIWDEFTSADSTTVIETADTLAAIASARFFDADTLTEKMIPFVQKIDETGTIKLSALAQEIIDDVLIPTVDDINESFPGLELDPDWGTVKPIVTSLLTAIKAKLGSSSVEELSAELAIGIISIMDAILQKAFEKAIYSLQDIPADQVASVVASWLTNLVQMVEQPVIDFIEDKLNTIFEKYPARLGDPLRGAGQCRRL